MFDFKEYKYSSYNAINQNQKQKQTKLQRNKVLELYGGYAEFLNYHKAMHEEREAIILE